MSVRLVSSLAQSHSARAATAAVRSLRPPHRLNELVAATQTAVKRIPPAGGLVVVLMILLCRIKRGRVNDSRPDGRREAVRVFECPQARLRRSPGTTSSREKRVSTSKVKTRFRHGHAWQSILTHKPSTSPEDEAEFKSRVLSRVEKKVSEGTLSCAR